MRLWQGVRIPSIFKLLWKSLTKTDSLNWNIILLLWQNQAVSVSPDLKLVELHMMCLFLGQMNLTFSSQNEFPIEHGVWEYFHFIFKSLSWLALWLMFTIPRPVNIENYCVRTSTIPCSILSNIFYFSCSIKLVFCLKRSSNHCASIQKWSSENCSGVTQLQLTGKRKYKSKAAQSSLSDNAQLNKSFFFLQILT